MKEKARTQRFVGHLALALGIVTLATFAPILSNSTRADNEPGVFLPQSITVFNDANRNGQLDPGESGINGVKVCAESANVDNSSAQCALTGEDCYQGQVIFALDPTEAYRFTLQEYPQDFFPTSEKSFEAHFNMKNPWFGLHEYYESFLPLMQN